MKRNVIISDLDGTISNCDHRLHLVTGEKKYFDDFNAACVDDTPNVPVIELLRCAQLYGYIINIFSGRSEAFRRDTGIWLMKYFVPFDVLLMRPENDNGHTPDEELKRGWLNNTQGLKEKVLFVLDDRQKVVDMWREEGLTCLQVAAGDF